MPLPPRRFPWSVKVDNLTDLGEAECAALRTEVQEAVTALKRELEEAKRKARSTGVYAKPGWMNGVNDRLRDMGTDVQRIQGRQTQLRLERHAESQRAEARRKAERSREVKTFEQRFVETARMMMPARQFRDICRASSGVIDLVPHPDRETEVTDAVRA